LAVGVPAVAFGLEVAGEAVESVDAVGVVAGPADPALVLAAER
jgi:hypothetical protein